MRASLDIELVVKCTKCERETYWDNDIPGPVLCQRCWDEEAEYYGNRGLKLYQRPTGSEVTQLWYFKNRDRLLGYYRRYHQEHKEEINEKRRLRRLAKKTERNGPKRPENS